MRVNDLLTAAGVLAATADLVDAGFVRVLAVAAAIVAVGGSRAVARTMLALLTFLVVSHLGLLSLAGESGSDAGAFYVGFKCDPACDNGQAATTRATQRPRAQRNFKGRGARL
ncbi:MAG: hypothetical protein QOF61_673 [Acidobacteriota bacterium]|nr:hypothetical protein [Acidobacteriota bacterium]